MHGSESTCWTLIDGAAAGRSEDRSSFAKCYEPVARAYLAARWRQTPSRNELDDAIQEVFVECFRQGGVLDRVNPDRPGGFRAFFYGVLRNVALRIETRRSRRKKHEADSDSAIQQVEAAEDRCSQVFDRAWAKGIMRQAADRQSERAQQEGPDALRRVELLRLRFHDNLPIREIAEQWKMDPAILHREYAKSRKEFRAALLEVMRFHHPNSPQAAERECEKLLGLLA
ncbi:MAG: sigma-70 family RNA polymerase sigma factor [Phycisphaerales bacterium]|nr:sigma-70 family RNA polymerase sigma factor [Phycisphaerales bacterium]